VASSALPVGAAPAQPGSRREACVLPGEVASVPQARRFLRQVLARWDRGAYEEAGTLLVSELVTNAVLHARSDVEVVLVDGRDGVLLTVSDQARALPVVRRHSRAAGTGRGLWLLQQYSEQHGVDVARPGDGKAVWAVLRAEQDEVEDAALAQWLDQVEGL
jgi:anti-sigma regulatory factor (Ser/Thr protein kinase)